jgi:hypothetical protein
MTEEKDTKKPGSAKRFLKGFFLCVKWLFVFILAALLIAGIYFQAPLKVLVLLAVFLIALTILPKRLRKWFWLTTGCVFLILVIWIFLPDDDSGDWKPYTFDDELAALEAKRAIPDDQNAALIYERLLEEYDPNNLYPENWNDELDELTYSQYWSSKDYPELANWVKSQQYIIDKLVLASTKDRCQFPIRYDTVGLMKKMERLSPMKRWAHLLIRAGNNDLGDGRIDEALAKYIVMIKMSKHVYQQGPLIEQLVAIAIESLGNVQIIRFFATGDATGERLSLLDEALDNFEYDWATVWPRVMDSEKLFMKSVLSLFYEINADGRVRLNRNYVAAISKYNEFDLPERSYWLKKISKGMTILNWFVMPPPQQLSEAINTSYERFYAMADPDFDWKEGPGDYTHKIRCNFTGLVDTMTSMLEGSFRKIHGLYLRRDSQRKSVRIIIALRRYKNSHGTWPESLDEIKDTLPAELLVDPVNNDSYVYKLTEDNFELYSKGENNIDDAGVNTIIFDPNEPNWPETKEDDILFWPKRDKKFETKKESINGG